MKIQVKRDFRDKEHGLILRKAGEILEVKEERGKKLISLNLAEAREEPEKTTKRETAG